MPFLELRASQTGQETAANRKLLLGNRPRSQNTTTARKNKLQASAGGRNSTLGSPTATWLRPPRKQRDQQEGFVEGAELSAILRALMHGQPPFEHDADQADHIQRLEAAGR